MKRWTILACAIALLFFGLALSNTVYDLTSPFIWSWHVVVRKIYSIIAFTVLGYVARRAFDEHHLTPAPWLTIVAIGGYSALIEVAQALGGSHEGLGWNAIDTACGAVGGAIATLLPRPRTGASG